MMNYQSLFQQTDLLDGGDNFRCLYYRHGGDIELISQSRYPMLFVLQGALEICFKYDSCSVEAENWMVIDNAALTEFRPASDTVVLIYQPAWHLADIFGQCSQIYEMPMSQVVPILPPLQTWIDRLLDEHMKGKMWMNEQAHQQRRELANIMMLDYPRRKLGELYAAFAACALGDCHKCKQEMDDVKTE